MNSPHNNPYTAGKPISDPRSFFGREDILREVMQMLRNPHSNAIVLYGQRRIGKTSILLNLEKQLEDGNEFTPIYFDLMDKADKPLSEVLYELAQRISIKTDPKKTLDHTKFDSDGEYFRQHFLPSAASSAASGGLVLLFDEFDVFDSPEPSRAGQKFFPYLRSWMTEVQKVKFVFVIGRRPEELSLQTTSTFKDARAARVSLLEREVAIAVIRQSEYKEGSLRWKDEAIEEIWKWTQGHPYFIQLLCSIVWDQAYAANLELLDVDVANVQAARDKALQEAANTLHWIWSGLPPAERVVTAAMAEANDEVIAPKKLIEILNRSGVRLIVRELKIAPETLAEWGLLRSTEGGYCFVVPLFQEWVSINHPLRRVKEELDRLDPQAESLFQIGQRFYNRNESIEAERQLRLALRQNPNHLKSKVLLGRVLLENEKVADSVKFLEEAYQFDEEAARDDLIKALLALAEEQAEPEQLLTYERVLNIEHDQPMAKEKRKLIWTARGEAAYQQDDLEKAMLAFTEAGDKERYEQVYQIKRQRDLVAYKNKAAEFENEERWEEAGAIYEVLLREFPKDDEWQPRRSNAMNQSWLAKHYKEALRALEVGNTQIAQQCLAKVISLQPGYREAARFLLVAVKYLDAEKLKQQILDEQQKSKEALSEINSLRLALEEAEQKERKTKERLDEIESIKQQLADERKEREKALAEISNQRFALEEAEQKERKVRERLDEIESIKQQLADERKEREKALAEIDNQRLALEEAEYREREDRKQFGEIESIKQQLADERKEREKALAEIGNLRLAFDEAEQKERKAKEQLGEVEAMKQQLIDEQKRREKAQAEIDNLLIKFEDEQRKTGALREKIAKLEILKNQILSEQQKHSKDGIEIMRLQSRLKDIQEKKQKIEKRSLGLQEKIRSLTKAFETSQWPVTFYDFFKTNINGWPVGRINNNLTRLNLIINRSNYLLKAKALKNFIWKSLPSKTAPVSDFHLTVKARQVSGPKHACFGIVFRLIRNGCFIFRLRNDLHFAVNLEYKNKWIALIDWTKTTTIRPGELNLISVIAEKSHLIFFINGHLVGYVHDRRLKRGKVGLTIGLDHPGDEASFEFRNFELRSLST